MTDRDLAQALLVAQALERTMREYVKTEDLAERDAATNVLRLAIPLRQKLETWVSLRTLRAQMQPASAVK